MAVPIFILGENGRLLHLATATHRKEEAVDVQYKERGKAMKQRINPQPKASFSNKVPECLAGLIHKRKQKFLDQC